MKKYKVITKDKIGNEKNYILYIALEPIEKVYRVVDLRNDLIFTNKYKNYDEAINHILSGFIFENVIEVKQYNTIII